MRLLITPKEAAEILRVNRQTVYLYCDRGVFPGVEKVRGTRWLIPLREVEALRDGRLSLEGVFRKDV
jgi:excisionase family DNA binding protein